MNWESLFSKFDLIRRIYYLYLKMQYYRSLKKPLEDAILNTGKIVLLYGARQTGKTTLLHQLLDEFPFHSLRINADEIRYLDVLSSRNLDQMKLLVQGYNLLFIDEAQRIPDAGINLKILHDGIPELKIIISGSSSLELANRTKEPLTGRLNSFVLFPVSLGELSHHFNPFEIKERTEELMIYGSYPEVLNIGSGAKKEKHLIELSSSYLYKDILELSNIRHSRKLIDLLRLLAFQVGSQVSLNELGSSLGMSKETVATYIDLLEKSFVIFRLQGFSRNLRSEVTRMDKFYFHDLGIRNALVNNFSPLKLRNDSGQLWENFQLMERVKSRHYSGIHANFYFWRTYTGAEIDLIEEYAGKLTAYEFKYGTKTSKVPASWKASYPDSEFHVVNSDNHMEALKSLRVRKSP